MEGQVDYYHAELEKEERAYRQRLWSMGRCKLIVATVAFGMGA